MLLMLLLVSLLTVSTALAEAPLRQQYAPYAPAGWRPQRPFHLPGDYLPPPPPRDIEKQQQQPQPQPHYRVQLSKERVDFAGQIRGNTLNGQQRPAPQNSYLPPPKNHGTDFLKVQRLPQKTTAAQFQPSRPQHQIFPQKQRQPQQFFNQRPPFKDQRPQQFFSAEQQQQQFTRPSTQYSAPAEQIFSQGTPFKDEHPRQFVPTEQQQQFAKPAQQYGAPAAGEQQQSEQFYINYPDSRNAQPDAEVDAEVQPVARSAIEGLNLAVDAHNRKEDAREGTQDSSDDDSNAQRNDGVAATAHATQGQYYVLDPDNRLQLVMFTAAQSDEEARTTGGFTAQLKYTPLGEINDPVFKYNSRGQLVRIVKK